MKNQKSPDKSEALELHNDPKTNRENQALDLPAYPHYPERQDLMGNASNAEKTDLDPDQLSAETTNNGRVAVPLVHNSVQESGRMYQDQEDVLPSDANDPKQGDLLDPDAEVTEEDYLLLGDIDRDQDDGDDEQQEDEADLDDYDEDGDELNEVSSRRAASGSDLDVPDDELENAGSAMQQEDEENDYFDLRGDVAEQLEDKESRNLF